MDFKELRVQGWIVDALARQSITTPTEVQQLAIPLVIQGEDVVAQSKTGSGKTLAYAIPMMQMLKHERGVKALIIAPTRELCSQIAMEIQKIGGKSFYIQTAYGGVDIQPQIRNMPRTDILVGAPGRLLDLMQRGALKLDNLQFLVLDEGDRMLDMGFVEDIDRIIRATPKDKQTLLFSATIPEDIKHLITKYMKTPQHIKVSQHVDAHLLKQYYYSLPHALKMPTMVNLLKKTDSNLSLVFCSTKRMVDRLTDVLQANGIDSEPLHGDLSQRKREVITQKFKNGRVKVLVATDVAARGLDIDHITHVYNFDSPNTVDTYTHRIGRTARIGNEGVAISLVSERDESFRQIYRVFKDKLEEKQLTSDLRENIVVPPMPERRAGRGRSERSEGPRGPRREHSHGGPRREGARSERPQRSAGGFRSRGVGQSRAPRGFAPKTL